MDTVTQGAIKDAGIKHLSDIAEGKIEEAKMKTIATMFDQGKSAEEIAKQ